LEYCDIKILKLKEQFYFGIFNQKYNICPTADSLLGFKHSEESKKISQVNIGKTLLEETKDKISKALGNTVFVYSLDRELLLTFPSSRVAAKHFHCSCTMILKCAQSQNIFKNKYIFSLEILNINHKTTYPNRTIFTYTLDNQLLSTFSPAEVASKYFSCTGDTILKYARSRNIFKSKYILSFEKLNNDFKPISPKIPGLTIFIYSLNYQLLHTFFSATAAVKYFSSSRSTITGYARSKKIFRGKYLLSLKELSSKE